MFFTVLADANFPSSSVCNNGPEEIRADGKAWFTLTYKNRGFSPSGVCE